MRLIALHHDSARCDALNARKDTAAAEERLRKEGSAAWSPVCARFRAATGFPKEQRVLPGDIVAHLDSLTSENGVLRQTVKDMAEKEKVEAARRDDELAVAEKRHQDARTLAMGLTGKVKALSEELELCKIAFKEKAKELKSSEQKLLELQNAAPTSREISVEEAMARFEDDDLEGFRGDLANALGDAALGTLRQLMSKGHDIAALLNNGSAYADLNGLIASGVGGSPDQASLPH